MARFENEGYCPNQWVDISSDCRLIGLWNLIGPNVVYDKMDDKECTPDTSACDQVFGTDPIAFSLLSAIVRKNVNADKILVHQLHSGACNTQSFTDIQKVLGEVKNPQLICYAQSNFVCIIADADYGLDLYIWDLRVCW